VRDCMLCDLWTVVWFGEVGAGVRNIVGSVSFSRLA
jgi:hypothetical protein